MVKGLSDGGGVNGVNGVDDYSADYLTAEIEILSLIDTRNLYENEDPRTEPTNMVLPNAMFFNGISIILDDTSSCQETQIGMNINILKIYHWRPTNNSVCIYYKEGISDVKVH